MSNFVHLRTHSASSIKDGLLSPPEIVALAQKDGQEAVAVTDLGLMLANIPFHEAAYAAGVKPVTGADMWIECDVTQPTGGDPEAKPHYSRLVLLARDQAGYLKLMEWMSRAYLDNQTKGVASIKQSWMRDEDNSGLIALSGDMEHGEVARAVLMEDPQQARIEAMNAIQFYRQTFGDRYYLEIQRYNQPQESMQVDRLVKLARSTQIPLVATHPVQFAKAEDFFVHELRYCISNGEVINDPGRKPKFTTEQYFKTQTDMAELFADVPEAVENTAHVSRRCNVTVTLGQNFLPHFDTGEGRTAAQAMEDQAREGLEKRLDTVFPDRAEREKQRPAYVERLDRELKTIEGMDFCGYFLIVADFIGWARSQDISVGPGRGSGAGSLVAYSLGITDINPLPYNLLFERFLNPERVSMPDFDVDFEKLRRDEVIAYVRNKYGENSVCQISTTGKLAAKAALAGVGGAMGLSPQAKLTLSKLIPEKPANLKLKDALFGNPKKEIAPLKDLVERYENEAEIHRIVDLALLVEKLPVNVGKHASGVLIAPGNVTEFSPLYHDSKSKNPVPISQYDGPSVERAGLVKFDFLGLKNLDIIKATLNSVNHRADVISTGKPVNLDHIPMDDAKTFKLFSRGETVGVFQFESKGMQRMLKNARPDRFEDLIALVALFRPGPMDLIPSFVARKHGLEEVVYPDPRVKPILEETYGVMVYQEQVMQVAQVIGGYSLGGADLLRRAMGKKKVEAMDKERKKFSAGAVQNGLTEENGTAIFDLMEKFAGYGFNKSHAAAYAVLAYRSAYLKANYPVEFYTALVNNYASDSQTHKKLPELIKNARAVGLCMLPPDINAPAAQFIATPEGIRYGMQGLKGVNAHAVEAIIEARKAGPFTDLVDFCVRGSSSPHINKRVIDALINVGAFDSVDRNRAQLLANVVPVNLYAGKQAKRKVKQEQVHAASMFEGLPEIEGVTPAVAKRKPRKASVPKEEKPLDLPVTIQVEPWGVLERLAAEQKVAGFYLSGHPFDAMSEKFGGLQAATPLSQCEALDPDKETAPRLVTGIVERVFTGTQKTGGDWGRIILNDGEESVGIMAFAEVFEPHRAGVVEGAHFAAAVRVERDRRPGEEGNSLMVDRIIPIDQLNELLLERLHIALEPHQLEAVEEAIAPHLKPVAHQGPTVGLRLHLPDSENPGNFLVGDLGQVALVPSASLISDLKEALGAECVKPTFRKQVMLQATPRPGRRPNRGARPR